MNHRDYSGQKFNYMHVGDEDLITEDNREMSTDRGSIDRHCLKRNYVAEGTRQNASAETPRNISGEEPPP